MVDISGNGTLYIRQTDPNGNIEYKINSGGYTSITSFPVTIQNSDSGTYLNVELETNITIINTDIFFIMGSQYIRFDGKGYTCTITCAEYPGLIRNGTNGSDGNNNIIVQNVKVDGTGGTLQQYSGWVGQQYFKYGNFINCNLTDPNKTYSGNVLGSYAGSYGGNVTASNCHSVCNIGEYYTGGIFGNFAGSYGGNVTASNCYSKGNIGNGAGGIFGINAGRSGKAIAINCYSIGSIAEFAGGIFGASAGTFSGNITATNCYYNGIAYTDNIIFGQLAGIDSIISSNTNYIYGYNGLWDDNIAQSKLDNSNNIWYNPPDDTVTPWKLMYYIYIKQDNPNTNIEYKINSSNYTPITSFPFTIQNSDSGTYLNVELETNITIINTDIFFTVGSEYIRFDGKGYTCTITCAEYPGLIQNGIFDQSNNTIINAQQNIIVQNVKVVAETNGALSYGGGWVGQGAFKYGNFINCSSNAPIRNSSGGILGLFAGYGGNVTTTNCYSIGTMDNDSGGIFGANAGWNNGKATAVNCYSTGIIGAYGGGIFGSAAGGDETVQPAIAIAINCYSTGLIGIYGGGIFGYVAGRNNDSATAINCYSTGNIGQDAGGIFGKQAGNNGGTVNATNCYSTGDIGQDAGGIFGTNTGGNSITAANCYYKGIQYIDNNNYGKLAGLNSTITSAEHIYGYISGWSDTNANGNLNTNTNNVWNQTQTIPDTPWTLNSPTIFTTTDGMVYDLYKTILSPSSGLPKTITLPLYSDLQLNIATIKILQLGSVVTNISGDVFNGASELITLYLDTKPGTIGNNTFVNCGKLNTIYYNVDYWNPLNDFTTTNKPGLQFSSIPSNIFINTPTAHSLMINTSGKVYSSGKNKYGQLGLGNTNNKLTFNLINPDISGNIIKVVTGNSHSLVLLDNGDVYGCGLNNYGQLGILNDLNYNYKTSFVKITNPSNLRAVNIATGDLHSLILYNDGNIYGCGMNNYGQLGITETTSPTTQLTLIQKPTNVSGNAINIVAGAYHSLVLYDDGNAYACGLNNYGQLGLGDTINKNTLTIVPKPQSVLDKHVIAISAGAYHSIILYGNNSVYACGSNEFGQLGNSINSGTINSNSTLLNINISNNLININISAGYAHSLIFCNDSTIKACGSNQFGQLGNNINNTFGTPIPNPNPIAMDMTIPSGLTPLNIRCIGNSTIVIFNYYLIYACGLNNFGQLADNSLINRTQLYSMKYDNNGTSAEITNASVATFVVIFFNPTNITKVYDGNNSLILNNTMFKIYDFILPQNEITITTYTASFNNPNIGTGKTVEITVNQVSYSTNTAYLFVKSYTTTGSITGTPSDKPLFILTPTKNKTNMIECTYQ